MSRCSHHFKTVVAVPCLLVALALLSATPAQAEIFVRLDKPYGGGAVPRDPLFGQWSGWIRVTSLNFGGQVVQASAPWHITPPAGVHSITLTKNTDASTPGLSALYASKRSVGLVLIDLVWLDARGIVRKVDEYRAANATLSSFTATPPTETLILEFASIVIGPGPTPPGAASEATRATRSRSGGTRTLATRTP